MAEGPARDRVSEVQRRRALRRRQARRRRAAAVAVLGAIVAAAVAVPLALRGGGTESAPASPRAARPAPTPARPVQAAAKPDGTLGDGAVSRACELLSRGEIAAQFGGPVGRPLATWPSCRWDVGDESFVSLRFTTKTPVAEARRRAYVLKSASGPGSGAFFGTDRALYFGNARTSFRLLYQRASEFTGIREPQLIALARKALTSAETGAGVPVSGAPRTALAGGGRPLTVYFAGDSLAAGPGWAFLTLQKEKRAVEARAEYEVGTGLLRGDYFDWVRHLRGIAAGAQPEVVVFMAGANDSQDAIVGGRYYPVGTSVWDREYRARVAAAMDAAGAGNRKVIWVGMPPMREAKLSNGMAEVDAVFRSEAARRPKVTYIDTWSLFDGPDGGYADQVTDATGRYVYVRLPDGIHLNVEGSQLLAREVAKVVQRVRRTRASRN